MLSNKLAIGSLSLGQHESHALDTKIRIAAEHGFLGVEVVYNDLELYARARGLSMAAGAEAICDLCYQQGLEILSLAPFENFEGDRSPLQRRLEIAQQWIDIARTLEATYLQVPAQCTQDCSGDESIIVSELRQLSDLGSAREPVISIAYEPMSWSTHVSTWQSTLRVIQAVDRPNFGLCLDSFHILTKLWGSPYERSGKHPNADTDLAESLASFKKDFPIEKLFYVQLSDGEKFDPPFSRQHPWFMEGEAAEFTWSKHARPFPGESHLGGYLPVADFFKACVVDKGFKGWVSMEIFDRRMRAAEFEISEAASRATRSWASLSKQVQSPSAKL
jgi:sugar phosphate isomerase/epimerase